MDLDVVILFDQVWIAIDDILLNLFANFRFSFETVGYCIDKSFSNPLRVFIVLVVFIVFVGIFQVRSSCSCNLSFGFYDEP